MNASFSLSSKYLNATEPGSLLSLSTNPRTILLLSGSAVSSVCMITFIANSNPSSFPIPSSKLSYSKVFELSSPDPWAIARQRQRLPEGSVVYIWKPFKGSNPMKMNAVPKGLMPPVCV